MLHSFHPIILAAGIGAVLAVVTLILAFATRSSGLRTSMILLASIFLLPAAYVFLALNPWLVDSRFRTYRAFYNDIHVGTTREQVLSIMEQRYPVAGRRQRPKI